jgi:hypothetical protein
MSVTFDYSSFYENSNQRIQKKNKAAWFGLDTEKTSVFASAFFKFLAVAQVFLTTAIPLLGAFGVLTSPITWIVAGSALVIGLTIAGGVYYYHRRNKEKNYDDTEILEKMQEKAAHAKFYKLYHKHGPENLVKHIFNSEIPELSIHALRKKFKEEVFGEFILNRNEPADFEHLYRTYDLDCLAQLQIAPPKFVAYIKKLQKEMDQVWHRSCQEKKALSSTYHLRVENIRNNMQKIEYSMLDTYRMISSQDFMKQMALIPVATAVSSCIDYGISHTSIPLMQQQKYEEGMSSLNLWYNQACQKIQKQYRSKYQSFFPRYFFEEEKEILIPAEPVLDKNLSASC